MSADFRKFTGKKFCFLAVGNPLKGDDAVGIYVGERIPKNKNTRVFLCYSVPENFGLKPEPGEVVFIIDGIKSGSKDYIVTNTIPDFVSISDHGPSLRLTFELIKSRTKEVYLIGIPVRQKELGKELSKETKRMADALLRDLKVVFG